MVAFTRKKIDSLTLGERLKKLRDQRRLSLLEISRNTNIQTKYLSYLEEGEYLKLPADVYVKGFLRSYAHYMGINENVLIKQYLREKGIQKNIKKDVGEEKTGKPLNVSSFVITPKAMIIAAIVLVVGGAFWYLYREVNSFVSEPRLFIIKPSDGSTVEGKIVHVTGVAEKDAMVTINDQGVIVNEKGEFSEDIGLQEGLNVIKVKARNRFDKETVKSVSVNAKFDNVIQQQAQDFEQIHPFKAEIKAEEAVWVSVEADGAVVYSGTLEAKSTKSFDVKNKLRVSAAKGKAVSVKINGNEATLLSTDNSPVDSVPFTDQGRQSE